MVLEKFLKLIYSKRLQPMEEFGRGEYCSILFMIRQNINKINNAAFRQIFIKLI